MLSINGLNNIVYSPRSQTGKVKSAFEAILNCSCSPCDVYFEHLQTLNIEELIKKIHIDTFEENEFYTDYPALIADNPVLLEHFIDLVSDLIINAFIQERYDFGDNIPENFARNFAHGIHQTIVFDSAFDSCFD
jgi:hypothetical protein